MRFIRRYYTDKWNAYRQKRFERLRLEHHGQLGVQWSFHFVDKTGPIPERVYLGSFGRRGGRYWPCQPDEQPAPKGNGAIALREFCELCDRFGLNAELFTEYRQLDAYYRAFGFLRYNRAYYRHTHFSMKVRGAMKYYRFAQAAA